MIKLIELEKAFKGQFIWGDTTKRAMATDENYEGNIESARTIFVGLSNVYNFDALDVCDHLDIGIATYNDKLGQWREAWKAGVRGDYYSNTQKRMFIKTCLILNVIKWKTKTNPYLKLSEI
jgi:hypothetical protein